MPETSTAYPVSLSIDYPDRNLNRLTTFFRIFTAIPIVIIIGLLSSAEFGWEGGGGGVYRYAAAGLVVLPLVLMLLFRQKYPKWWFDWNLSLTKFSTRVFSYLMLLTDQYPSTDKDQAVHIEIRYPDASKELKRGMPLIKWFLVIPHIFILVFLYIGIIFVTIIAWFSILFTGKYPESLFEYVVGVMRWSLRVSVYAFLLTTDKYPLFSLK